MTLQQAIDFDQFVRCYCVGQQEVMIMAYDPRKAYLSGEQYVHDPDYLSHEMADRVRKDVRTLCSALGYDLNTVEFAIKDGVPYAIDFMNPAPDAELASVGEFYHHWITTAVTNLVFKRLAEDREAPRYRWDALLNPEPTRTFAVASQVEQESRTVVPNPVENVRAAAATAPISAEAGSLNTEGPSSGDSTTASKPSAKKPRKNGKATSTRSKAT
jgi:hypothetical protein